MSDADFIALYNSHGNAACQAEFCMSYQRVMRYADKLRKAGHEVTDDPPLGYRTNWERHGKIAAMEATMNAGEISRATGLTLRQVRFSISQHWRRKAAQRTGASE